MTFSDDLRREQSDAARGETHKFGVVQTLAPLTVRLDGDTSDTPVIDVSSLPLVVGDSVWCHHQGTRVIVLGRKRSEGPTIYPLTPNTVPGNWADYGSISFGTPQATVYPSGLVVVEGMLKPLVSGTMLTATEYLVGGLPIAACPVNPRGALYGSVSAAGPISVRIRAGSVYLTALQSNIPFTTATWFALNGSYQR